MVLSSYALGINVGWHCARCAAVTATPLFELKAK